MPTASPLTTGPTAGRPPAAPVLDPLAAVLSYLVPGLGQIVQGRVGKGVLFLVGLYALFFYGMYLGRWSNVFLADVTPKNPNAKVPHVLMNLYERPHFAGQFWIGVAAWPALVQYLNFDASKDTGPLFGTFQRTPPEGSSNDPPERITLKLILAGKSQQRAISQPPASATNTHAPIVVQT